MSAVCHRCGGDKSGPFVPCKGCGFVPTGDERSVAWLFAAPHLEENEQAAAAERIRAGEHPDPSQALRDRARREMGAASLPNPADLSLSPRTLVGIAAANLILTPLFGFALWFGWRENRPAASAQALRMTLPLSVVLALLWVGMVALRVMH